MKTILALFLMAIAVPAFGQTFGLGYDEPRREVVSVDSGETYGLGGHIVSINKMVPPVVLVLPTPVIRAAPRIVSQPYVEPAGFHRHVKTDGTIIIHEDFNFGDPVAHAGVARPWPKYFGGLQPTIQQSGSACPNGGQCPQPQSVRSFRFLRRFR